MDIPRDIMADIVKRMISCRDFCGDEHEELRDLAREYKIPYTQKFVSHVFFQVNKHWRYWQKQAGVPQKYWK
jgi:hypothetical protein